MLGGNCVGEVYAIVSGKGGTGKTSVCAGLACALAEREKKILCIDCDVGLRNLDISLGMSDVPALSFLDVSEGSYRLEDAARHPKYPTLRFFTAPMNRSPEAIDTRAFGNMLRQARQAASNYKYAKSWLAICLPVAYCLLDAAGTFADSLVLDNLATQAFDAGMFATFDDCSDYAASAANCAYELTFLFAAVCCFIYVVLIRKQKLVPKQEGPKYLGAIFETAGQFAYIFALADTAHVAIAAPIISAYCVASVVWSRIFLKEKLSWKHYAMIALVVVGIVMLGIFDI